MASSSSMPPPTPLVKDEEPRNWADIPPELTSSVLVRLGAVEILENAQRVCRSWRRVSKEPSLWRKIEMRNLENNEINDYYVKLCCNAVDRSEGGLVEISIGDFGTESLLAYIADRSPNLRSLGLEMDFGMTNNVLVNAVAKFPLLEVLEISQTFEHLDLKAIGHSCPKLSTLKLNCSGYRSFRDERDDDAFAIAESMLELRHLQLIGNRLTDTGLTAILDNCPHLEHLDLRQCLHINLSGDLEMRCLERVKDFRRPNDSTADYPYDAGFYDSDDERDFINGGGYDDIEVEHDFSGDDYSSDDDRIRY